MAFYIGLLLFYYSAKIYHSPLEQYKEKVRSSLIGAIISGLIGPFIFLIGIQNLFPSLDNLFLGFGCMYTVYAFWRTPQLAYFLPFQVYRLMIINESGLPIYKYIWNEFPSTENDDEEIIPAMFSGMGTLLQNTINRGLIQEIHLEHAKMLFTYSKEYKLSYIIVASQSSSSLRQGLARFQQAFEKKFKDRLDNVIEFAQFTHADEIIKEVFIFIP
jgi:hypothetical protein